MRLSRLLSVLCASTAGLGLMAVVPPPTALAGPSIGNLKWAGERPGATRLKFGAGDSVTAQVDVGTGNLLVSVKALQLVGVKSQIQVGAFYNSFAADQTDDARFGNGWGMDPVSVRVKQNSDKSMTYTAPGGLTGVFDLKSGSTTSYSSPKGFKVDLVKDGDGWKMTDHKSQTKQHFKPSGYLESREDRDGNKTTLTSTTGPGSFPNVSVVAPAGPTTARTIKVVTDTANKTTLTQTTNSGSRSVAFTSTVGSKKTVTKFTDALGRDTTFGYDSSARLTSVSAPGSVTTGFTYDASNRVTSIRQTETSTGGPGTSVTRLSYTSGTETLLADPSTDQAVAVGTVAHTTYTLDSDTKRVNKAVDPEGRTRSDTYTANFDSATSSAGSAGQYQSNASNDYNANGGESLTKSTSPEGAAMTLSYGNTSGPAQYMPTTTKNDAGKTSTYTYTGTGNMSSSSNALSATAKLAYNPDGTIATATAPEHSGDNPINPADKTQYSYTNAQMTQVTPKAGTSLGVRNLTYDTYGRVGTASNGRGITATYSYDNLDRMTGVSFSDGSKVSYGYDAAGRSNSRVDSNGTTSYTYDQLGRLTARSNTAGGGTFTYGYNRASWLIRSTSTAGGTVTYGYDKAGKPSSITYPYKGTTSTMRFQVDSHGRRTHTWLGSNADHTKWVAHYQLDINRSDKVTRVRAWQGSGDDNKTAVVDLTYCYKVGKQDANKDCDGSSAFDRSKLQWKKDNLSGQTTDYVYDDDGRLSDAQVSSIADFNYAYDKNGNRKYNDGNDITFNDENQITNTGYAYDGAGNLTKNDKLSAIAYTAADQMKSVTKGGVTYTYKHAGADQNELLSETTPKGTYSLAYGRADAQGKPVIEQASKDSAVASVLNDPVTGQPLMLRTSSGMQSLYVYDGTPGNPIALITSGAYLELAYSYDPFGVPTLTQSSNGLGVDENPYAFAGGIQDRVTGWIHFGNRYYDPSTGTWTQMDTLDSPLDPGNANRYAYAGGDPINNIDPLGKKHCLRGFIANATFNIGVGAIIGATVAAAPFTAGTSAAIGLGLGAAAFSGEYFINFDAACG